ncbi:4Fe-4S binding protein [Acidaminobacter sp. JC074]|uniref:4Fe-4S binding protein n=1 Tax=Acidaminobacter sp. JC074 TaxID=2530199 RepID=UPI001F0E583B|nr:4Fe-4S binding protein [Acidaminobacter sp. JC074]MCH4889223.1 4Fe-4S binding protein [Acidaminobacter sp. JC074]
MKLQRIRKIVQLAMLVMVIIGFNIHAPILLTALIGLTFLAGVFYCGWVCPFGFIQDTASFVSRQLGFKSRRLPNKIHQVMIYFRYIFYIMIVCGVSLRFLSFEPRSAFYLLLLRRIPIVGVMVYLVVFTLLSMFYDRFFCRYLCPEGAKYGLMSLFRVFTIKRASACVSCKKCDKICPMQIQVSLVDTLKSPQCINCFQCISACPIEGCLKIKNRYERNCYDKSSR